EELVRLNVKIRRLLTFLYDNHVDHYRAVCANIIVNPPLMFEISSRWASRNLIHEKIVERLLQTSRLPGFSGSLLYGQRKGRDPSLNENVPPPAWVTTILGITRVEVEVVKWDDMVAEDEHTDVDIDVVVNILDTFSFNS
ncbi:hypothetical protein CVT25_003701, partial [Psilocybe cyanescens]